MNPVIIFMGLSVICASIVANAPTDLSYLWELKAAAASFAGLAALLLTPPGQKKEAPAPAPK